MLELAEPGDRVGILAENIPEYVECYYGVPAAGMALTFLNYRLHPKEWVWILNNAEARVLIVEQKYLEQIEPLLGEIATLQHVIVIGDDGAEPGRLSELRRRRRSRGGRRTATRRRRGLDRVVALHQRDDGVPEGRDAHPPQPHRRRCWHRSSSTSRSPTSATWWRSRCATSPDTPCRSRTCAAAGSC